MGSLRRCLHLFPASGRALATPLGLDVSEQGVSRAAKQLQQNRGMAGGHHGDHGITHEGVTIHKPASWQVNVGKGFGAVMWFWIFYRFYHDYDTFLFGHAQHFEHELHEEHAGQGHNAAHAHH